MPLESTQTKNNSFLVESFFVTSTIVLYLLLDFLPTKVSLDVSGHQWLAVSVLNILVGYIVYTFSKGESAASFKELKLDNVTLLYGLYVGISLFSYVFALNKAEAIMSLIRIGLIFCFVLLLKFFAQIKVDILKNLAVAISLIAFFQCFTTLSQFFSSVGEVSKKEIYKILTQNAGNINIFSATLAFKLPFVLYCIYYFEKPKKWFFTLCYILIAITLCLALARTSIITLIVLSFLFIVVNFYKKLSFMNVLPILLGLILSFSLQNKYLEFLPKAGVVEQLGVDEIDQSSGRTDIWKNTIELIKEKPLLGYGVGNYKIQVIPYESKQRQYWQISKHSHNDFLQVASETGIINGLIYLSIFLIIAWKSFKVLKDKNTSNENFWSAFVVFSLVFAYGFDSSLNFPKERIITLIHFAILLFLYFNYFSDSQIKLKLNSKFLLIGIMLFSAITIYPNYLQYKSFIGQLTMLLDEKSQKLNYKTINESLPDFPNLTTNGYQIATVKAKYLAKEGRYEEAIKLINDTKKYNPYMMFNENTLASIYNMKKMPDSVFVNQEKCLKMFPLYESFYAVLLDNYSKRKDTVNVTRVINYVKQFNYEPKFLYISTKYVLQSGMSKQQISSLLDKEIKKHEKDSLVFIAKKVLEQESKNKPNQNLINYSASSPNSNPSILQNKPIEATKVATESVSKEAELLKLTTKHPDNFKKQLPLYLELNNINPAKLEYSENIGICYYRLNKYEQAIPYLQKVVQSKVNKNGKSEYVLAACYHYLKNSDKACKYAKQALLFGFKDAQEIIDKHCK